MIYRYFPGIILVRLVIILSLIYIPELRTQTDSEVIDSLQKARELLQEASVEAAQKEIDLTIRSVEITKFPLIKIFVEAYNKLGEPLDSLTTEKVFVFEKGIKKKVVSVEKIPVSEESMVDFIFAIDVTGSMQKYINAVIKNVSGFTNSLVRRGIDYRLGLILFSDDIEKIYQPTKNVVDFLSWLSNVQARGGGDEKENALEAMELAAKETKFRFGANKVIVLITDAPYHQLDENGDGVTNQTTESIIKLLVEEEVRVFSIVPPRLENYRTIAKKTRGNMFDIDYPFSTILDKFSNQLTNLYSVTYLSEEEVIPDSIEIALYNDKSGKLIRRTIPIVELGRKLIIENLLYNTNSYELPENVKELDILTDFMLNRPNVAVIVEGHTDNVGSKSYNDNLSKLRAESVKKYLEKKGINSRRIKTKGYGLRKPIASNATEFGRKLNRRTEIVIVAN